MLECRQNLQIHQVLGPEIKADIGTKNVNAETLVKLMKAMNFEESTRRHPRSLRIASDDEANNKGLSPGTESMNGNTNGVEHDDKEIEVISSGRMKLALFDHADQTRTDDVRAKYLLKTRSLRNWSAESLDGQMHQVPASVCDERWPQLTISGSGQGGC